MSKGLKALESLVDTMPLALIETNSMREIKIIEKELKRLEELEKAFDSLSKEDEKTKKLLSKEIEKNRALEIIKSLVDLTKENNHCWLWLGLNGKQITQEQYDLLKEVLL